MLNRKIYIYVVFFTILSIFFTLPIKGHAVPAAPVLHTLSQPDGAKFEARQWGDEWLNGWETSDGYSIVFDEDLGKWAYAANDTDGSLRSSSRVVGADDPPLDIRHLRPARQNISANLSEETLGEGIQNVVPPTGTANVPIILINFNNTATSYTTANFNTLLFGTGNYSMKDYYQEVSYGAFSVSAGPGGVVGWYTASNTHDYYGYANGFLRAAALAREAVVAADNAGFNFAPYDQDGDCYVDVVNIVHQGNGTEASGNVNDIWSHSWSLSSTYTTNDPCPAGGFIRVSDYVIQPETLYGGMQTMGVFAHEYGHALGLPDLYDTDGSSEGIGDWSLMAGGSWNQVTRPGDRPAHMDAWSKYYMGWVTPTQVAGTLTNEPIVQASASPDVYKLLTGTPASGEYFLVENRQKTSFDAGLPGPGLLIWHIDGAAATNNYECYPGGPSCASGHYKVKLVQADNLWELEKNLNRGNTGDPYPGSTNNLSFTSASSPNSNLRLLKKTGIKFA
ncbi:MAG: M6 family metalloprotease domain-containing protein [Nitrospirae bacterium]|nr:M6 family metalloprotease domain-containing protein [Nitrospirota bacterium]